MTVWITHLVTFANENVSLNIKLGTGFNLAMHFYRSLYGFFKYVSQDISLITNISVITLFVNNKQNIRYIYKKKYIKHEIFDLVKFSLSTDT